MADIGKVTPGQSIWPDPEREPRKPKRDKEKSENDNKPSPPPADESGNEKPGKGPDAEDDGHIDVYV